jgi:hypothetical protein
MAVLRVKVLMTTVLISSIVTGVVPTRPMQQSTEAGSMASVFGENSPSAVTIIGVFFALIAVVGSTVLGWEWGASFAEQPIPFVLGACMTFIAIVVTLQRKL